MELLQDIRSMLESVSLLKRKSDCYITPHENWMPTGTNQPCIGIRFGGAQRAELACSVSELTVTIQLIGFVRMTADGETAVCGEAGAWALQEAATGVLQSRWGELDGCQGLVIGSDTPTDLYVSENALGLVKLVRTVVCTLEI